MISTKILFSAFIAACFSTLCFAQTAEESLENNIPAEREADYSEMSEKLQNLKEHPLNLNKATKENLQQSMLFNDIQIANLLSHIAQNGALLSVYELQAIDGFSLESIGKFLPYITTGNDLQKDVFIGKRNEISIQSKQILEKQKGYTVPQNPEASYYKGSPLYLLLRCKTRVTNNFTIGFSGEKDPGEQFFRGAQKNGFDYYSGYALLQHYKWINTFIAGDYEISYGQGISGWTGFSFGKTVDIEFLRKYASGIRPHTSSEENNFMRGAALSLNHKDFRFDIFYSSKNIDGNILVFDSVNNRPLAVSSLQTSGYHRTLSEISDEHSVNKKTFGAHVEYSIGSLSIGATSITSVLSVPLIKDAAAYKHFDFSGTRNTNFSLDYSFQFRNMSFFGESSINPDKSAASVNGCLVSLDPKLSMSIVYRNYSKTFQSVAGSAFGENSSPQNEEGSFVNLVYKMNSIYTFSGYVDIYSFPWLKYLVNSPSSGTDYILQLSSTFSKKLQSYVRVKIKNEEKNSASSISVKPVSAQERKEVRLHLDYNILPEILLRSRIEFNRQTFEGCTQHGFLMYQDFIYKPSPGKFSCALRYSVFDTDSYDTRIYAFENSMPSSVSFPSYFYKGSRFYILLHWKIMKDTEYWIRFGQTLYEGKATTGSGLDETEEPAKTDMAMQLRLRF